MKQLIEVKIKEAAVYSTIESEEMDKRGDSEPWSFDIYGPFLKEAISFFPVSGVSRERDDDAFPAKHCRSYMYMNTVRRRHNGCTTLMGRMVTALIQIFDGARKGESEIDFTLAKLAEPQLTDRELAEALQLDALQIGMATADRLGVHDLAQLKKVSATKVRGKGLIQLRRNVLLLQIIIMGGQISTDGVFDHGYNFDHGSQSILEQYPKLRYLWTFKKNSNDDGNDNWIEANITLFFLVLSVKLNRLELTCSDCTANDPTNMVHRASWHAIYLLYNLYTVAQGNVSLTMPFLNKMATADWLKTRSHTNVNAFFSGHFVDASLDDEGKDEEMKMQVMSLMDNNTDLTQKRAALAKLVQPVMEGEDKQNPLFFAILVESTLILPEESHYRTDGDNNETPCYGFHHSFVACSNCDPGNTFHCHSAKR